MTGRHAAAPTPVRRAVAELAALLLSVSCAGCGAADVAVCRGCHWALVGPVRPVREAAGTPVVAVVPYCGPAQRMLLGWKDDGRHDLAPLVRSAVARSVRGALALTNDPVPPGRRAAEVLVVSVPSAPAASRRRGGDVLAHVTRDAVQAVAIDCPTRYAQVLRQRPHVADQAGLSARARRTNLFGALTLGRGVRPAGLAGRRVVVVDDVVTTGATLVEAVRVLRDAGAEVLACAVVAATPLRRLQPAG